MQNARSKTSAPRRSDPIPSGINQQGRTWAHSGLTRHGEAFDRASLECTHELPTRLAGQAPTLCRARDGRINSVGLAVCGSLRYAVMLWSEGVTGGNARAGAGETPRRVSPRSVVLAHDGGPQPNAPLMQQLDHLAGSMTDAGDTFVTVRGLRAARGPGSADGVPGRPRPGSP